MAKSPSIWNHAKSFLGFAAPKPSASPKPRVTTKREARISGAGQPQYLASTLDVQRVQNALRAAERGDTWMLFTIFRDMVASYGHLNAEWGKRKTVITGNPEILIPASEDEDDKIACEVVKQIIMDCENWRYGLKHLMDATLYPLAAAEKIWEPVSNSENARYKHPLRFRLKEIAPIDPTLLCFKLPYVPSFGEKNDAHRYNPDDWESWLRFYSTNESGAVNYNVAATYKPDRAQHIIHKGAMLSPIIPPNFGGLMRQILFPWLLSTQGRDWFAMLMQKYGQPILVGKTNSSKKESVATMQEAFALCTQLGGIVVDQKDSVEFAAVASTDSASAHVAYQKWLDSHVSRLVTGSSLASNPEKTGMGSGMASQAEEIREDIRQEDCINLSDTLKRQLFQDALTINGYRGRAPEIVWGGMRAGEAATFTKMLMQSKAAGLKPTKRGLDTINRNVGVEFEIDKSADQPPLGRSINAQDKENNNAVKY